MLEVSRVGIAESDDEIELSLELSIGGNYGKSEKLKQVEDSSCKENGRDLEVIVPRSGFSFAETLGGDQAGTESGSGSEVVDSQRKREIQALRRQQARRKREEKLRKSSANSGGVTGGSSYFAVANANEKSCLEALQLQGMARDREIRGNDDFLEDSARKKGKFSNCVENGAVKDSACKLKDDETGRVNNGSGSKSSISCLQNVPLMQMQDPYSKSEGVPLNNGSVYPYSLPCWVHNVGREENEMKERNMFQAVSCGTFSHYLNGNGNSKHGSEVGSDSEQNSGKSGSGNHKAMSYGSLERTSSGISDHRSTSGKGGSSCGTGNHSSRLQANERQLSGSVTSNRVDQPRSNSSSANKELGQLEKRATNSAINGALPTESQLGTTESAGNTKSDAQPPTTASNPTSALKEPSPLKRTSEVEGNDKLKTRKHGIPSLPCVSTTGNGPNAKTITGFLYRYTRSEISIVCVCHGSSFSPAEFVEHAGGTDITHPLRHITMIPPPFG